MARRLAMLHFVPAMVGLFGDLAKAALPGFEILHILDEPGRERVSANGGAVQARDEERFLEHARAASEAGADALLVTCTLLCPLAGRLGSHRGMPLVRVDEAMYREAVARGRRIGLLVTNAGTVESSIRALGAEALRAGREIEVRHRLVEGAFAAFLAGETERHDALLRRAVEELAPTVDVVVLAQASMARALASIPESSLSAPLITSPHSALAEVARLLHNDPGR